MDFEFWSCVATTSSIRDCWLWTGPCDSAGYGLWKGVGAHRVAFAAVYDCQPKRRQMLLHACDNPPCVNPRHLRIGTAAENANDRKAKLALLLVSGEVRAAFHQKASSYESPPMLAAGAAAIRRDFWRGVDLGTLMAVYRVSRAALLDVVRRRRFSGVSLVAGEPEANHHERAGEAIRASYSESRSRAGRVRWDRWRAAQSRNAGSAP